MNEVSANHFRQNLKSEVDRVIESHEVLRIRRQRGGDFVVVSAEDWHAVEETLFLNQQPGLVTSIHQAAAEPLEDGTRLEDLDW